MEETTVVLYGPKGVRRAAAVVVGVTLGCAAAFAMLPLLRTAALPARAPAAELHDAVADLYAPERDKADEAALAALRLAERQLLARRRPAPAPRPLWKGFLSPATGALLAIGVMLLLGTGRPEAASGPAPRFEPAAPPSAGPLALPAGYELVRVIGEGGMGVVYEARDAKLGRSVALKRMRDEIRRDRRERDRFLQEARLVASLHHRSIVDIHTIVEDAENVWLVFEYVSGKTVQQLLEERRCLALGEVKRILRDVCAALDFAHRHGVVHRDLKPSNIMVADDGEVKVMDFGVARRAKDSLRRLTTKTIAGTPLYMAPEAEDGVVRRESDVYALGACLYEMVTGEGVFSSPTTRAAKMCRRYVPPSRQREGIPSSVDMIVDWALQPDPERRIPTAAAFAQRLEEVS
jgi:serine/threonine protein kinase